MRGLASLLLTAGVLFADDVEDLVKQLRDPDRCEAAVDALVRLGKAAVPVLVENPTLGERALLRIGTPAVQPIVQALSRADQPNRYYLIRILGQLGPVASEAVPALRRELAGPCSAIAALELTKITPDATWGIPSLVEELEKSGDNYQLSDALARLGPSAKPAVPILRKLGRAGHFWRGSALRALWWIEGDPETLLPDLRAALATRHADDVATVLGIMGSSARPAIPDLLRVLKSPPKARVWFDRDEVLGALVEIGLQPEHAPAIRPWLSSDDDTICVYGTCLLGSIRPFPRECVADLSRLLFDDCANVRSTVAVWLGRIGHASAVPALLRACADEDSAVVAMAARSLRKYGKRRESISRLRQIVRQKEGWHRWHAAWVLGELDATSAVEDLEAALSDQEDALRYAAAAALGKLKARSAVPSLQKLLSDKASVTAEAALALHRITGKTHLAPLRKALTELPRHTLQILGQLGPAARPLLPEVRALREHRDVEIAAEAVFAGYVVGGDAEEAVQRLIHVAAIQFNVSDAEPMIVALGRMGPAAGPARPFLIGQLRSANKLSSVRVIREALARIDPR